MSAEGEVAQREEQQPAGENQPGSPRTVTAAATPNGKEPQNQRTSQEPPFGSLATEEINSEHRKHPDRNSRQEAMHRANEARNGAEAIDIKPSRRFHLLEYYTPQGYRLFQADASDRRLNRGMARSRGFEPPTPSSASWCSIH